MDGELVKELTLAVQINKHEKAAKIVEEKLPHNSEAFQDEKLPHNSEAFQDNLLQPELGRWTMYVSSLFVVLFVHHYIILYGQVTGQGTDPGCSN